MAQLGKLVFAIKDSAGNALSGVSIEVRKQGAQVNGLHSGLQTSFTVDDPGAVVAGDQVAVDTNSTVRSVSSVTATTVVVGGAGFNNVADDSRLTDTTLPTIYNDAIGNETKSNPLTTDAAGEVFCWVIGGKYDVLVSGGGATTKLYTDQTAAGGESKRSTIFSGTAWQLDSLRALAATDEALVISENSDAADLFKVMGDGEIQAGAAGATHSLTGTLTVSGATTLSSTLAVTGATTAAAITSSGLVQTTAAGTALQATVGNLLLSAGDVQARRMDMRRGTQTVAGDYALSAGWGATPTFGFLQTSYDTRGSFQITANGAGIAANPTVTLTFKDGAYSAAPVGIIVRSDSGVAPSTAFWVAGAASTTSIAFQFLGLPVAGSTYAASYVMVG